MFVRLPGGTCVAEGEDGAGLEFKVDQEPDRAPGGAMARTVDGNCRVPALAVTVRETAARQNQ